MDLTTCNKHLTVEAQKVGEMWFWGLTRRHGNFESLWCFNPKENSKPVKLELWTCFICLSRHGKVFKTLQTGLPGFPLVSRTRGGCLQWGPARTCGLLFFELTVQDKWSKSKLFLEGFVRNQGRPLESHWARNINRMKFRSQTSDNMDRWKSRGGKSQRGEAKKWEDQTRERVRRKKMQVCEKVGKPRFTVFCQWFGAPEGRKVGSLKRRVPTDERWKIARHCGGKRISKSTCTKHLSFGALLEVAMSKKRTPLWREAHLQVKMYKSHQHRTTFGSWTVEKVHALVARSTCPSQNVQSTSISDHSWKFRCRKVHAVVARSTFPSQNVQSTSGSDHFWKLRCRKSARHCGAKRIFKSKCTKYRMYGPLLEVEMSKKCTPLWREAHVQVKIYKARHLRTTFDGWDLVLRGRRKGFCTLSKVSKTWRFCSSFNYNYNYNTLHYTTVYYTTLHSTTPHYTTLHYTTLHWTTLQYTTLQYTTLDNTPLHYTTPQYTTLHYTTPQDTTLHCTTLHYITLRYSIYYTTLHSIRLHYTPLHAITIHYTTPHYNTLHHSTLHYTTLHYPQLHYATLHLQLQPQLRYCTTLDYTT